VDVRAYDGDNFSLDLLRERDYFHEDCQVELHKLEACSTLNNWGSERLRTEVKRSAMEMVCWARVILAIVENDRLRLISVDCNELSGNSSGPP
jgi:hypothetical protein